MARAYSIDLRKKVLSAWLSKEGSQRQLAKRFKVSLSFIRDLLRQYRETGQIIPLQQGGDHRSKLKEQEQELLKKIIKENNDIYLREIQDKIKEETGIQVSVSSICNTLKKMELRRKKNLNSQ